LVPPKDIMDDPTDAVASNYIVQPRSTVLLMSRSALPNSGTIASAGPALQGKTIERTKTSG